MPVNAKPESSEWYVIYTHPKQENRAESNLQLLNVETFVPRYQRRRYKDFNRVTRNIDQLFPRYIFAKFPLTELYHKIRYTRGVHSFVTFDQNPAWVDEEIIELMRQRVGREGFVRMNDDLEPGDEVVIKSGPFLNLRGIFERETNNAERIMILLDSVSYQTRIVVSRSLIEKKSATSH
jgi:transcriptional antiterminator RfaH